MSGNIGGVEAPSDVQRWTRSTLPPAEIEANIRRLPADVNRKANRLKTFSSSRQNKATKLGATTPVPVMDTPGEVIAAPSPVPMGLYLEGRDTLGRGHGQGMKSAAGG